MIALAVAFAVVSDAHDVKIVVAPPCLSTFRASGRVGNIATAEAKKVGAKTTTQALGQVGLFAGDRIVLPDPSTLDAEAPAVVVAAASDDVTRTVLAEHLPALRSPEELAFAMPGAPVGFVDGLLAAGSVRGHSPDLEKIEVTLVRLEKGGARALAVELPHGDDEASSSSALPRDPLAWDRTFAGIVEVDTPMGEAQIVSAILTVGGAARLKPALDVARGAAPGALTVMPGFVAGYPPREAACLDIEKAVAPDVVVPGAFDFRAGVEGVQRFAGAGAVVLAANLNVTGAPAYTRTAIVVREVDGKRVALIGLVDPAVIEEAPAAARAQIAVDDPVAAAVDVVEKAMEEPQPPDLVVVITASHALAAKLAFIPNIDIVIAGPGGRTDALDTTTRVDVEHTPREQTREPSSLYTAPGSTVAVRTVTAHFEGGALTGVVDTGAPTTAWSPRDMSFVRALRVAEEADFVRDAPLLLPRLDDVLALAPASTPPAKGVDVPYRGAFATVAAGDSPIWTDPLFHRLVANVLRRAFRADAAFTAATPRRSDLGNAAVARRFVTDWLAGKGDVRVFLVKGADLLKLAGAVNRQASTHPSPATWIYASGIDADKGVVGGRKIDPAVTYRVAVDDKSAARVDVAAALAGATPAADVAQAPADAVVLAALAADDADPAKIARLLADESQELAPEWRFAIDGVDVHGTGGRSSDGLATIFGATHEARAVQPAFAQLGAHGKLGLTYDDPLFAWETKLNVQYESILLTDVDNAAFLDQTDDLVLSTEGRLNSVSLSGGAGQFRVVPFLQVAGDSELTPVLVPNDPADPAAGYVALDRQLLARASLGVAAYPGGVWKEVRAGLLLQEDASAALAGHGPLTSDAGVGAESHIAIPFWKLVFTSDIDARWFIPDGDDTAKDLALRAQLVHKIALPVTATASVFVFLDALVLYGKKGEATRAPGWNAIAGAGLTFADLWRF